MYSRLSLYNNPSYLALWLIYVGRKLWDKKNQKFNLIWHNTKTNHLIFWCYRIADAEENLGESEVREAHLAKSLFFIRICDKVFLYSSKILEIDLFILFVTNICLHWFLFKIKLQEKALEQLKVTEGKTVAVGHKMDLVFYTLQLGFFYTDFDLISKCIDKAKRCIMGFALHCFFLRLFQIIRFYHCFVFTAYLRKEVTGRGRIAWKCMRVYIVCPPGTLKEQLIYFWIPFQRSRLMRFSHTTPSSFILCLRASYHWTGFH